MSNRKGKKENNEKGNLNVYEERFYLLMKLIRIDHMLKNAKVSPAPKSDK